MSAGQYLSGLGLFLATWAPLVGAAALLVRRRLPHVGGAPRVLAVATLTTTGVIAAHLLPGVLGVLSRWTPPACALAFLAAVLAVPSADPGKRTANRRGAWSLREPGTIAAAIGAAAVGVVSAAAALEATVLPSGDVDTLTFHLPNVARWIQSGTFWRVDQFTPLLANGNYPHNGDVVFLSLVLPWESDAFVRPANLPYAALAALSVYAIGVELRAAPAAAALAATLFGALPAFALAWTDGAKTDAIMLAALGTGVLFLIRHFHRPRPAELVIAGLALGLAFGTKWYGVTTLAVIGAVWLLVSLLRAPPATVARHGAALAGLGAAAGGFWLVRNLVESGNPVFPVEVTVLGTTLFDAPRDFIRECAGHTIAGYLGDWEVMRDEILPSAGEMFALPGLVLGLGALATLVVVARARRERVPGPAALLACVAGIAVAYALTPYTALGPRGEPQVAANTRWLLPALLLAAPVGAWAASRIGSRRARALVVALALVAVGDGLRRGFTVPPHIVAATGALVVAGGLLAAASRRALRGRGVRWAIAALAIVALTTAGYVRQREFNHGRYAGVDPTVDWIARHAPEGRRIGLAGVWSLRGLSPVLPAFGPRLGNEVVFVGDVVDGQLREIDDPRRWAAKVRGQRLDLVLVGRGGYSDDCPVPGERSDDDAFARAAGLRELVRSDRLTLYRTRGT